MKPVRKYSILLVLLNVLIFIIAYFLIPSAKGIPSLAEILILSSVFSLNSFITLFIFTKGQTKEPDSQTLYSLVAISLKFLLEMIIAVLWFFVAKKTSLPSVLIFFVLYLALTLFSVFIIVKILKNKSL